MTPNTAEFPVKLAHREAYDDENGLMPAPVPAYIDPFTGLVHIEGDLEPKAPIPICPTCHGAGSFPGSRVDYGSTTVQLPAEPCDTCFGSCIDLSKIEGIQWALRYAFVAGSNYVRDNIKVSPHAEWDAPNENECENKANKEYQIA